MQLIPAIDLLDGGCVRLLKGDFAAQTRYAADPRELMAGYRDMGAAWLHVVDLNAARGDAHGDNRAAIGALTGHGIDVQVGGGLRDQAAVARMLDAGASRAVIGSAAITQTEQVRAWLDGFGGERLTLAFDVRIDAGGTPRVATHGWREQSGISLWDALSAYDGTPLQHVLCTDVDRDGALSGPNLSLYQDGVHRFPALRWQASGGIRDAGDLHRLAAIGVDGAISGKALLDARMNPRELGPFLPNA
jgi:phosphoribosylformimino-5-aminoimidazole carboxamide ribotide isomerase